MFLSEREDQANYGCEFSHVTHGFWLRLPVLQGQVGGI
jgi:hypothetical protein